MKKGILNFFIGMSMVLLTGCCLNHEWVDASCLEPKTCAKCGKTEGELMDHIWLEATCTEPKTCSVCKTTEGEKLEHIWLEATCTEPKTCSVCKETEGETLEHLLTEANFQEPAMCTVCGTIEGGVLEPEALGIKEELELNTVYEFIVACDEMEEKTTVAKVEALNYHVFESDDEHPAKDGYEWKTVDIRISVGDDNAQKWGYYFNEWITDYYWFSGVDETGSFEVYYNGIEYPECRYYVNDSESDWVLQQYGWEGSCTILNQIHVLVPKGYDGVIYGFSGGQCEEIIYLEDGWSSVPLDEYVYFRFK